MKYACLLLLTVVILMIAVSVATAQTAPTGSYWFGRIDKLYYTKVIPATPGTTYSYVINKQLDSQAIPDTVRYFDPGVRKVRAIVRFEDVVEGPPPVVPKAYPFEAEAFSESFPSTSRTEAIAGGGTAICCNYRNTFLKYSTPAIVSINKITARVSRGLPGSSSFEVRIGSRTGAIVAVVPVPATGNWTSSYIDTTVRLSVAVSGKDFYITFDNATPANEGRCNLDKVTFELVP